MTQTSHTILLAMMLSLAVSVVFLTTLIWSDRSGRARKAEKDAGPTVATATAAGLR